jgi:hypothetical protein
VHTPTEDESEDEEGGDDDDEEDEDDEDENLKGGRMILEAPRENNPKWVVRYSEGRRTEEQRDHLRQCVRWGVGLEHETMLVHRSDNGLEEYIVDAGKVLRSMANYGPAHGLSRELHEIAVYTFQKGAEFSGRRCAGSVDITFRSMVEAVSKDARELSFDGAQDQITRIGDALVDIANSYPNTKRIMTEEGVGPVTTPRTGMSSELGMYQRLAGQFFTCASCGTCPLKDYTGSYHVSITLPADNDALIMLDDSILVDRNTCAAHTLNQTRPEDEEQSEEKQAEILNEWIRAHTNLGNMFQWIEPLIQSVFGAADAHSVCDAGRYTEGSYRTMSTGWGVPGTTDVRTFSKIGTGRYVEEGFDWLFPEDEEEIPGAYREDLSGCMKEGMGADIRIKSRVDEHDLGPGESLPPMEVWEGIELRIFDNFDVEYMPQVYRLISVVAEAGRHFTAPEYIYDNTEWSSAMQHVQKEGWNAILPAEYVTSMATALNLPVSFAKAVGSNTQAFHVYQELYKALWEAHSQGFWTQILLDDIPEHLPAFENANRHSWEIGAINAGFTPNVILETLGLKEATTGQEIEVGDLQLLESKAALCDEDTEDLIWLAETYGMISSLSFEQDGSIASFSLQEKSQWDEQSFTSPTCSR